jgi:RNA polymerase sigma-70 factor (ECF subfamily)
MITQLERLKQILGREKAIQWDKVFTIQLPRILNYFRFHGLETQIAEDLTATTFEKAWRTRQSYRNEKAQVSTWLFTIAHHTMIDYFRTRRNELPLEAVEDLPDRLVGSSPEEATQSLDDKERLRQILLQLPERERELVALKYGAQMTNRAIANHTGLTESNVGTILSRVITTLRTQLEEQK